MHSILYGVLILYIQHYTVKMLDKKKSVNYISGYGLIDPPSKIDLHNIYIYIYMYTHMFKAEVIRIKQFQWNMKANHWIPVGPFSSFPFISIAPIQFIFVVQYFYESLKRRKWLSFFRSITLGKWAEYFTKLWSSWFFVSKESSNDANNSGKLINGNLINQKHHQFAVKFYIVASKSKGDGFGDCLLSCILVVIRLLRWLEIRKMLGRLDFVIYATCVL